MSDKDIKEIEQDKKIKEVKSEEDQEKLSKKEEKQRRINRSKNVLIVCIILLVCVAGVAIGIVIGKSEKAAEIEKEVAKKQEIEKEEVIIGDEEKSILEGKVKVYKLEEGADAGKVAKLDLNLDGKKEVIELGKIMVSSEEETMDIMIGKSKITYESTSIWPEIVAFSMDKKKIIVAAHASGMSDDPSSVLYTYDGKNIFNAGMIPNDISQATQDTEDSAVVLQDEVLKCWSQEGTISNYVNKYYDWNGRKLVPREDTEYDYVHQDEELRLIRDIKVHEDPTTNSNSVIMNPGTVHPIKMGPDYWNYIRSEDGTEGWIYVDMVDYFEYFENMNMAG